MKEIVIKIPDNMLDVIKNSENTTWLAVTYGNQLVWQVKNGTPLPKGHGRLIDADNFVYDRECVWESDGCCTTKSIPNIAKTPTLVEADKGDTE